ncbi:O-fucosyltransferase family protein [Salinimicrobium xinjiangense]|uniref:hypothetical protein n=1 Tax=Salinimicrobium xinjiangense TaxID=438596 RepID=UPI000414E487|nr:hypothetical protein [Salinimicrobium xinjiangense]
MNFNILGRPDGLGNRIEEIILASAFCSKEGQYANYIWNNKIKNRTYDIKLTSNHLKISEKSEQNVPYKTLSEIKVNLSQNEILKSGKEVKPNFDIHFKNGIKPIGIHIRGTDRINNNNHPHFMKDKKEFFSFLSKALEVINNKSPKHIFVTSDDSNTREVFIENLNKQIIIINPVYDKDVSAEYVDFFALTLCEEIIMCSKFSSFAITASLIGNIPLISFSFDDSIEKRYKALFKYELNALYRKDLYLEEVSSSMDLSMLKKRLLSMCKNALRRF